MRIRENSKTTCRKENTTNFIKNGMLWEPKKMLRVKMEELKSENLFEEYYLGRQSLLKLKIVNLKVTHGLE